MSKSVLVGTHADYLLHDTGRRHPERPDRLGAATRGISDLHMEDSLAWFQPRAATDDELCSVHPEAYVAAIRSYCSSGGGHIDADTVACGESMTAATRAAGAGPEAAQRLRAGEAEAAMLLVRPPGHHATSARAMGFCLFNNVAVTAACLAAQGERVMIIDFDAHHGNGTQDIFWDDPEVLYVSLHEYPQYPGTGRIDEIGGEGAEGTNVNIPLPSGATGDVFLAAMEQVVGPVGEAFDPDWTLISAGFDAHRADPLTDLGLSAGDYAKIAGALHPLLLPQRSIAFLEGGYDLDALRSSTTAFVAGLSGLELLPERPTSGGPGLDVITQVRSLQGV